MNRQETIKNLERIASSNEHTLNIIGNNSFISRGIMENNEAITNAIQILKENNETNRCHDDKPHAVYVCSPYKGNDIDEMLRNLSNARKYCKFVAQIGHVPIAPHVFFTSFLDDDDPAQRKIGMHCGTDLLQRYCDELWVFGTTISAGMKDEIAMARTLHMPIKFIIIGGDEGWIEVINDNGR